MGLFDGKRKDGSIKTTLKFVDGLSAFTRDELIELTFHEDKNEISIKSLANKSKPLIHLKIDKIINTDFLSEKEIIEKSKSVGGRAVAGGLLLGPLGAIVGGMSGIGSKQDSKTKYYIVINYKSNDEYGVLSFEVIDASTYWNKILKAINNNISEDVKIANSNIEL